MNDLEKAKAQLEIIDIESEIVNGVIIVEAENENDVKLEKKDIDFLVKRYDEEKEYSCKK